MIACQAPVPALDLLSTCSGRASARSTGAQSYTSVGGAPCTQLAAVPCALPPRVCLPNPGLLQCCTYQRMPDVQCVQRVPPGLACPRMNFRRMFCLGQ